MKYQYEVKTLGHFLRRVAIDYVRHGYFYYALREIPPDKDPQLVEQKLITFYEVTKCRTRRFRRRQKGLANVQYVRIGFSFMLLATDGYHPTFERVRSYDIRSAPLHFRGYSIGIERGKPCVKVCQDEWKRIEYRFSKIGLHRQEEVERKLSTLPYCQFPGVIRQKDSLVEAINTRRKLAGLSLITIDLSRKQNSSMVSKTDDLRLVNLSR
jgi:hypothetical protein